MKKLTVVSLALCLIAGKAFAETAFEKAVSSGFLDSTKIIRLSTLAAWLQQQILENQNVVAAYNGAKGSIGGKQLVNQLVNNVTYATNATNHYLLYLMEHIDYAKDAIKEVKENLQPNYTYDEDAAASNAQANVRVLEKYRAKVEQKLNEVAKPQNFNAAA